MNVSEAKSLLALYRPGTADAEDPQMAEALTLAKQNAELAAWVEAHRAQQEALRTKFKQITPPAGLKEQIISEYAANQRAIPARHAVHRGMLAVFVFLLLGTLVIFWLPRHAPDNTFAIYQNDMARVALGPYGMSFMTNDPAPLRAYLAQNRAPSDYRLPASLRKAAVAGCAVEEWQGAKVSLVCFRTGKPLPPGAASDLWLFVVDRTAVKDAPDATAPQFAKVNRLMTATWSEGGKLYFLGIEAEEPEIQKYFD